MIRTLIFILFSSLHLNSFCTVSQEDSVFREEIIKGIKLDVPGGVIIVKVEFKDESWFVAVPWDQLYLQLYNNNKEPDDIFYQKLYELMIKEESLKCKNSDKSFWKRYRVDAQFYEKIKTKKTKDVVADYLVDKRWFKKDVEEGKVNALILYFYYNRINVSIHDMSGDLPGWRF